MTIKLEVTAKKDKRNTVNLNTLAVNQDGITVAKGSVEVIAPTEKLTLAKPELPAIGIG